MNVPARPKFRDPALVDFGTAEGADPATGRRLERIGGMLVDRPLAHARLPARRFAAVWREAGAIFEREGSSPGGRWRFPDRLPDPWQAVVPLRPDCDAPSIALEVRPAPSGQIGVFLEQMTQWQWLFQTVSPGARMLSLFAHSGAATLALAAAGAEVVHVDASRPATEGARRNASASGLEKAPIRWISDDARGFVAREIRRGARYDGVVLDPPSWGHGPKGQAFSVDRDLEPLLAGIATLLERSGSGSPPGPLLLTCHSPGWHHERLRDTLTRSFGLRRCESGSLDCTDDAGRSLSLGGFARHTPDATPR